MTLEFERDGARVRLGDAPRDREAADRQAAAAMPARGEKVLEEVAEFVRLLAAVPTLDYDLAKKLAPAAPLPSGYSHLRLFRRGESAAFHRSFIVGPNARPMTLHNVLYGVLQWPGREVTRWSGTWSRPDAIPGVLDLEVDIDTQVVDRPLRLRP
ncbi:hypothetical protein GON01_02765 [Sphingomonas sp. MAH-20]|uniref:Uncharacterized protein n=1 Tax=Sphingomonas horti TaxID=2682842 RepID=A0A6I4IXD7_9SPHN|nr:MULTISPECIES: hypothetical protein [Sphingomonas]MBA2920874.1 hypothetical protein [Sphingomonas sp. CGMCC 1.13658]MVO76860.1 hypothetical protein [Sphingomonas horti]